MSEFHNPPQVPPRSTERVQQLEVALRDLQFKNENLERENSMYKNQLRNYQNDNSDDSIVRINDPFVDIAATTVCSEIETCLEETNSKLTDATSVKPAFVHLINKLASLVTIQYNNNDLYQLNRLKEQLFTKLSSIDQKVQNNLINERKLIELETAYEQLKKEFDAVKASISCKQLIDSDQIDTLTTELLKWKDEIKSINTKVHEQNELIKKLVTKCEPVLDSHTGTPAPPPVVFLPTMVTREEHQQQPTYPNVSPGGSPTEGLTNFLNVIKKPQVLNNNNNNNGNKTDYSSYHIIDNDFNTIRNNNDNNNDLNTLLPTTDDRFNSNSDDSNDSNYRNAAAAQDDEEEGERQSLKIYQCPICNTQVSKDDFTFEKFYEHVSKCDANKLTCILCLRLFEKSENEAYIQHVGEHYE